MTPVLETRPHPVRPVVIRPARATRRATGRWTVMDHAEIAWQSDGAELAVASAREDARLALAAEIGAARARAARFRTLAVERSLRGAFVAWTATVVAEA